MSELNQLIEQITQQSLISNYRRVINTLTPTILKKYKSARLYYEAGLANELGNVSYSQAIVHYSDAINIDPGCEEAIYDRGRLYLKAKEFDLGARDFERLISLDPEEQLYHQSRGEVYIATGDNEKAIACFNKAIELQPDSEHTWCYRGYAWLELNEPEKSIEDETRALLLKPNYIIAYCIRGEAFSRLSQYEKAIEDFTQAIKLDPAYLLAYEYRASVWESMNNYAKAIEDYSRAMRFEAERPGVYLKRGEIYFRLGEYEKALTDFNASSHLEDSDEADAGKTKAIAELNKGNYKERFADKKLIREKAASFLDKIRVEYGDRFKKATDGFRCGRKPEWDFELNRPITADLEGWLPDIMPDIAKWDVVRSPYRDKVVVDTLTPLGELFYPHLIGIPIKEELWDAIAQPFDQHKVGERTTGYVQKFQAVGELLERLARTIRMGRLDDQLIMEYYHPEVTQEKASRAMRNVMALRSYSSYY